MISVKIYIILIQLIQHVIRFCIHLGIQKFNPLFSSTSQLNIRSKLTSSYSRSPCKIYSHLRPCQYLTWLKKKIFDKINYFRDWIPTVFLEFNVGNLNLLLACVCVCVCIKCTLVWVWFRPRPVTNTQPRPYL